MTVLLLIKMGVLEGHSHDCSKGTSIYITHTHKTKIWIKAPFWVSRLNDALGKSAVGTHFKCNASVLTVTVWEHSRTNPDPSPASLCLGLHNAAQQSRPGRDAALARAAPARIFPSYHPNPLLTRLLVIAEGVKQVE